MIFNVKSIMALLGLVSPSLRLPDERHLDHLVKNHNAAMQGAERYAHNKINEEKNSPQMADLKATSQRSVSTIDQLVREMQARRR